MSRLALFVIIVLAARADAVAPRTSWFIQNVSTDGKHVLLSELGDPAKLHFRLVAVDTNTIETDLELPVLSALPLESMSDDGAIKPVKLDMNAPGLDRELPRAAALLAAFPFGAADRIAASPDGAHTAFNGGDWIYTATDGKVVMRVAPDASYAPWFTPDGKTLLFRREHGLIDGVEGNYELYATSSDGSEAPRELIGTSGVLELFAPTDHGTVRVLVTSEPNIKTCVVDVGLVAPYPVKRLGCLAGHEHVVSCVLSPKGTWLACVTETKLARDPKFRLRTMEVATGKVYVDRTQTGTPSAISDDGLFVGWGCPLQLIDARGQTRKLDAGDVSLFTHFRSATELIAESGGNISILDVTKAR